MLASAAGALAALLYLWHRYNKPDVAMACNGLLGGLVAITAPCAFVTPAAAVLIGAIAAAAVDPDFLRSASSDELSIAYLSGAEWTRHLAAERAKYEAIWRASPSR